LRSRRRPAAEARACTRAVLRASSTCAHGLQGPAMRRPALAVFGTGGAVACAARGGLQGRRPRDLRGRPGGGSSARLDPVGGAACTRWQQPTGPRSVFRASHLPLLCSAAAGSCSPPPPASSSPSSAELLPAPANRQQRLASGWGESVRPPPMWGGVTSPDVGGRNGGRRWSGYGESCSPNVGWGGRLRGTVGGSLRGRSMQQCLHAAAHIPHKP